MLNLGKEWQMAVDLPRPKIDVTQSTTNNSEPTVNSTHVNVVISRDGKGKSYHGTGTNTVEVVKDVVEQILNDPYTGEWIKNK